jgi:hypothetical protein
MKAIELNLPLGNEIGTLAHLCRDLADGARSVLAEARVSSNGALYDYRQDPLEKSPLAQTSLTPAQEESHQKLQKALDSLK